MTQRFISFTCFICGALAVASVSPAAERAPPPTPTTEPTVRAAEPTAQKGDDLTHLSLEDLMDVQVTSVSKKKQSILDAPAAVTLITADDISRSGFSTIPDLLRLAPGTDIARVNGHDWAVAVRGQNDQFANKLLVIQDGRSLYTPLYGGVFWDTVDYVLQDLDRIEVIRGPGATLWGANAVNGVINITSKDSRDTQGWLLSARGSNDDSNFVARYGGKLSDDTYYRVYLKTNYDAGLIEPGGGNAGDDWYGMRGGFRIDKHPDDNDTYTLQGDLGANRTHQRSDLLIPTPPFAVERNFGRTDATGNVLARWDHRAGADSDFSLQMYYDYLKYDDHLANVDTNTFDIDFHHRFKLGASNEVVWGMGYRLVNSNITASPEFLGNPATRNDGIYSAFIQDTLTLVPEKWFLTIGSKLEHNDYTGFEFQPSARLLWKPNEQSSVWAAVSRAVSTPSRDESNARVTTFLGQAELQLQGNPNQRSEELLAYELGYRVQPAKEVSIDVTAFYNNYDRLRGVSHGAPQFGSPVVVPAIWDNDIKGETYGGEVAAKWRLTDRWRLEGSYSLLEARFGAGNASDSVTARNSQSSAPRNQAQIHSYWDITSNLQLNAGAFYVGRVREFNIPAYISTDLNLTWRPRESLEFTVGVLNLFDNHHPEFGVTGGQGVASETPRTFYGQMTYRY